METIFFWIGIFGLLAILGVALWRMFRRMHTEDLPPKRGLVVLLEDSILLPVQLDALAAQWMWTDRDLIQTVWLADPTENGTLAPICAPFCAENPAFHYCRVQPSVKDSRPTDEKI